MGAFIRELVSFGIYKRNQGRITRQITFAAVAVGVALGLYRLSQTLAPHGLGWSYGGPLTLLVAGVWASYRLVNVPGVADFLIAVEAEMNKVSWPTKQELFRASMVVLIVIFVLAVILALFDIGWVFVFRRLHII